jgi:hypothetical protein
MPDLRSPRQQDYELCIEAMAMAALQGRTLADCVGEEAAIEAVNFVSAIEYARKKETPAKTWWDCAPRHPAVARALRIDPSQLGACYALTPFRLWNDGYRHLILCAFPCPRILGPIDMDHLEIEAVLAWDPREDIAYIMGDAGPALFGHTSDVPIENFTLYASPRDFLTDWAIRRAHAYVALTNLRKSAWADAEDRDTPPGALAVGPIDRINLTNLPRDFAAQGFDVSALNRQIIKQARLPRARHVQNRAAA